MRGGNEMRECVLFLGGVCESMADGRYLQAVQV